MAASEKKAMILKVLRENPDGLTIQEIAKTGKMSRITATVYIQGLLGEGVISERKIGSYRMLYMKDNYMQQVKKGELIRKLSEKVR